MAAVGNDHILQRNVIEFVHQSAEFLSKFEVSRVRSEKFFISMRQSHPSAAVVCMAVVSLPLYETMWSQMNIPPTLALSSSILAAQMLVWLGQHRRDAAVHCFESVVAILTNHNEVPQQLTDLLSLFVASIVVFEDIRRVHDHLVRLESQMQGKVFLRILQGITEVSRGTVWPKWLKSVRQVSIFNDSSILNLVIIAINKQCNSETALRSSDYCALCLETACSWIAQSKALDVWCTSKLADLFTSGMESHCTDNERLYRVCHDCVLAVVQCFKESQVESSTVVQFLQRCTHICRVNCDQILKNDFMNSSAVVLIVDCASELIEEMLDLLSNTQSTSKTALEFIRLRESVTHATLSMAQVLAFIIGHKISNFIMDDKRRVAQYVLSVVDRCGGIVPEEIGNAYSAALTTTVSCCIAISQFACHPSLEDSVDDLDEYRRRIRDDLRLICSSRPWMVEAIATETCRQLLCFVTISSQSVSVSGNDELLSECWLHACSSATKYLVRNCKAAQLIELTQLLSSKSVSSSRLLCRLSVVVLADLIVDLKSTEILNIDLYSQLAHSSAALMLTSLCHHEILNSVDSTSFRVKQDHIGVVSLAKCLPVLITLIQSNSSASVVQSLPLADYSSVFEFAGLYEFFFSLVGQGAFLAVIMDISLQSMYYAKQGLNNNCWLTLKSCQILVAALASGCAYADMRLPNDTPHQLTLICISVYARALVPDVTAPGILESVSQQLKVKVKREVLEDLCREFLLVALARWTNTGTLNLGHTGVKSKAEGSKRHTVASVLLRLRASLRLMTEWALPLYRQLMVSEFAPCSHILEVLCVGGLEPLAIEISSDPDRGNEALTLAVQRARQEYMSIYSSVCGEAVRKHGSRALSAISSAIRATIAWSSCESLLLSVADLSEPCRAYLQPDAVVAMTSFATSSNVSELDDLALFWIDVLRLSDITCGQPQALAYVFVVPFALITRDIGEVVSRHCEALCIRAQACVKCSQANASSKYKWESLLELLTAIFGCCVLNGGSSKYLPCLALPALKCDIETIECKLPNGANDSVKVAEFLVGEGCRIAIRICMCLWVGLLGGVHPSSRESLVDVLAKVWVCLGARAKEIFDLALSECMSGGCIDVRDSKAAGRYAAAVVDWLDFAHKSEWTKLKKSAKNISKSCAQLGI